MNKENINIKIDCNFPGGNISVLSVNDGVVNITPDLRGGNPWFYWYFNAIVAEPCRVKFCFQDSMKIGISGPAVSCDNGGEWKWLGLDNVEFANPKQPKSKSGDSFVYKFTEEKLSVRFAMAMPYLQSNLDRFLEKHSSNIHLKQTVLTKTNKGRSVELLQIGKEHDGAKALLMTARHHACESMSNYLLEGFLQEVMSDSREGIKFRDKYVLYVIPMVDKDGVEDGDQGKGRKPHDHNRDYGNKTIYPEIKAIRKIAFEKDIKFALDLHCPFIRGYESESFYFYGLATPHIYKNTLKLLEQMIATFSKNIIIQDELFFIPGNNKNGELTFAGYFAKQTNTIFSATLEVPYAQKNLLFDINTARLTGGALLKAWNKTNF